MHKTQISHCGACAARPTMTCVELPRQYESPYSLEVLAIAQWVMQALPQAAANVEQAIPSEGFASATVEEWQPGQRKSCKPQHVKQAWQRLLEQQWLLAAEPV